MSSSPPHPHEASRIEALSRLGILDTASEKPFDGLVELASLTTATPIALLSFVDIERLWFKANVGLDMTETSRLGSFCSYAILNSQDTFVVEDATKDERFADNPLVTQEPLVRFYAGACIHDPIHGVPLGTLCAMDHEPRQLTSRQLASLRTLADQAEQLLAQRVTEAEFRSILDNSSNFIGLLDRHGNWMHANQTALQIVDKSIYELQNQPFWESAEWAHDSQLQSRIQHSVAEAATGKRVSFEATTKALDGKALNFEFTLSPEFSSTAEVAFLVAEGRDVTGSRRTASSRELGEIIDRSRNEIFIFRQDNLRFVYVNKGARDNLGRSMDELQQMTPLDIKPQFEHSQFLELVEPLRQGKQEHLQFETVHRRKDESLYNVEVHLQTTEYEGVACFIAIILDTTVLKSQEARSRELGEILARSRNEIFIFRQKDFRFVYVNNGARLNLGYSLEEMREMTPIDIKPEFTPSQFSSMVKPLISGQQDFLRFETVHQRKDSTLYHVDVNLQMSDYEGESCLVAIILDTTTLKKRTDELEHTNNDLEDFASIASHDLKTPLRGISNLASFVQEDEADKLSEPSKQNLDKLQSRIHRMELMIGDMLAYLHAGRNSGPPTKVQTKQLVEQATEVISPRDTFQIKVADELPAIRTYAAPLQQVFQNLIENAIKYHHRDDGVINITASTVGRYVQFTVADDGPGIDPKYHTQIFEMFRRLHRKDEVEGTGLGLALVRKTIRRLGGDIWVESKLGEGSSFHFTWPTDSQG